MNIKNKILTWMTGLAAATALAGLTGCYTAPVSGGGDVNRANFVVMDSQDVTVGVQIADIRSDISGDLLRATVIVVSTAPNAQKLAYRFRWFTATGEEFDPEKQAWIPFTLEAREGRTISSVAPHPTIKQFKIDIKARKGLNA